MVSHEGFLLTNPKDNNCDLEVLWTNSLGQIKRLAVVKPGTQELIEKSNVTIKEVALPQHFSFENGSLVPDKRRHVPGLRRVLS